MDVIEDEEIIGFLQDTIYNLINSGKIKEYLVSVDPNFETRYKPIFSKYHLIFDNDKEIEKIITDLYNAKDKKLKFIGYDYLIDLDWVKEKMPRDYITIMSSNYFNNFKIL